ncbi:hypothetical protein I6A84_02325 [Frankia sp. CNm7]|uniref:DUF2637 domain-containing protein n=1 Tax=Frankia nepalensis TaxID=1836974 RepID=A0A937RGX0_9ACTN|nr:hypothetical protein [Frankia nepalensis]MBL7500969.1 hypothetical protein [Frankia nepalensis]MBL7512421.1 hypothetical protein [Frankia nepalensis]MBL7516994.1 hypothetical protein [Frankia nepalensis]MBL7631968.1 hypothetical protein [Frankia nepalensis]
MTAPTSTSSIESNRRSVDLVGPDGSTRLVTVIVGVVVTLTFLFGFGNVLALGLRLGVPVWVAPLVAPAVDLSVVGLLLGSRQLAVNGGPVEVRRSARKLLIFASMVTLALNIAEPLIAGRYGKATFDAVGPLLLIGWSEVGPGLLSAMQAATADRRSEDSRVADGSGRAVQCGRQAVPVSAVEPAQSGTSVAGLLSREAAREARMQDLLHRARAEALLHWQQQQRPISAETLRKRLHVGADTARGLVAQIRSDTQLTLDNQPPKAASA